MTRGVLGFLVIYTIAWVFVIILVPSGKENKCDAYESVTGRETKYVSRTCFVKFKDSFYTQE